MMVARRSGPRSGSVPGSTGTAAPSSKSPRYLGTARPAAVLRMSAIAAHVRSGGAEDAADVADALLGGRLVLVVNIAL